MKWTVCLCAALLALLAALVSSKSLEPTPWEDQNADSDALAPAEPNALSRNKRFVFGTVLLAAAVLTIAGVNGYIIHEEITGDGVFKRKTPSFSSLDELDPDSLAELTDFSLDLLHNSNVTKRGDESKKLKKGRKGRRPRTTPAF